MARVVPKNDQQALAVRGDGSNTLLTLVKGGPRAYLWIETADGRVATFSGPATLRQLARAILKEVPA